MKLKRSQKQSIKRCLQELWGISITQVYWSRTIWRHKSRRKHHGRVRVEFTNMEMEFNYHYILTFDGNEFHV